MKLVNVEMIPGVIINVNDDKCLGRVKCASPGLFDPAVMPEETLPWIYPISMAGHQHFSKPVKGDKVWIVKNPSTYNEYWYITFFEFGQKAKDYIKEYYNNDPEILLMRESGPNNVFITYDNSNGYQLVISDKSFVNINNDKIELRNDKCGLTINGNVASLGCSDESLEQAVLGNTLVSILSELSSAMKTLQQTSLDNQFTIGLNKGFAKASEILSRADTILTKYSKIN